MQDAHFGHLNMALKKVSQAQIGKVETKIVVCFINKTGACPPNLAVGYQQIMSHCNKMNCDEIAMRPKLSRGIWFVHGKAFDKSFVIHCMQPELHVGCGVMSHNGNGA